MSSVDLDLRTYVTQTGFGLEAAANQAGAGVFDDSAFLVIGDTELAVSANPAAMTDLNNQVRSYPVTIEQDENDPTIWIARAEIPADDGGFFIREAGVRVGNRDSGYLYCYARQGGDYKPTLDQGQGKSYTIRLKFIPGNASVINAKIDPSVQFATPTDLDNAFDEHKNADDPHEQYFSEHNRNISDAINGTSSDIYASQAAVKAVNDKFTSLFLNSKAQYGYQKLPSGLIIQWGIANTNDSGIGVATLPIAFPNAHLIAVGTHRGSGAANVVNTASSLTTVTFKVTSMPSGTVSSGWWAYYIAIGY